MDKDEREVTKDIIDAVVVYSKDFDSHTKKERDEAKKYADTEEVIDLDQRSLTANMRDTSSADQQLKETAELIIKGEDKNSLRKKITKILNSGDPLVESKTVMVVLARRELQTAIRLMDSISYLDGKLLDKVDNGDYDNTGDFEISNILHRLERSLARSMTIVDKVLGNPVYEEFLLAYREDFSDDNIKNVAKIATSKESRAKIQDLLRVLGEKVK